MTIQQTVKEELDKEKTIAVVGLSLEMLLSIINQDTGNSPNKYFFPTLKQDYLTATFLKRNVFDNSLQDTNKIVNIFMPSIRYAKFRAIKDYLYTVFFPSTNTDELVKDILEGEFFNFTPKEALKIYFFDQYVDYDFFQRQSDLAINGRGLLVGLNKSVLDFQHSFDLENNELKIILPNGLTKELISSAVPLGLREITYFGVLPGVFYQKLVYEDILRELKLKSSNTS